MNSKSIHIKSASKQDYPVIADIYNEYILSGGATMDENPKTAADISNWVEQFNLRERLFVLQKDKVVIGWGIIKKYSDRSGYRFTGETAIYLTRSQLGKGYGTYFKKYLLAKCKELGYHHLVAKIFADNKTSIHYNKKLGYTIVGKQKEVGFRDGKWYDIVIMQYIFDKRTT